MHSTYTPITELMFSFWNLLISYAFEKAVVRLDLFYSQQLPRIDKKMNETG